MRSLTIGNTHIGDDSHAYVIAEVGHNHEGELCKAEQLVREAAKAGASAVKLQKRDNRSLYTKAMYNEPYTGRNSYGPTYGAHREFLEFGESEYRHLSKLATELGIDFMSTAFDEVSVDFLVNLDLPAIKLASADLTNTPLLTYAAKTSKPLVVSTGAAGMDDVKRAMDAILPYNQNVALLQCTAVYPATPADLNLRVIDTYRNEFPSTVIGYSGHDSAVEMSIVAYSLGARVIEKHFTLDRTRPGSDHHFSLEPAMLSTLVEQLDDAHTALGSPEKVMDPAEKAARRKMGKQLVAARALPAGHVLSAADIAIKSPGGDGLAPHHLYDMLGRALSQSVAEEEPLAHELLV